MASVELEIASRKYQLACRDGEEAHLRSVAAIVDKKARDAGAALGTMTEARQLLFASLLLADEIKEHRAGNGSAQAQGTGQAEIDPVVADALERLAERIESLAERLETRATNA